MSRFLKVIACEIAVRELQHVAAGSKNLIDLEFLTQGHHDTPALGRKELQDRINAIPKGKYDAITLGYALCSSILVGLTTEHTPVVIPRAHDCITFFLGSKECYQRRFSERPGTYYYTSGWLECARRRGLNASMWSGSALPANAASNLSAQYQAWAKKFGEEQARYLVAEMSRWTEAYTHGCLIDFDFLGSLDLARQVQGICKDKAWSYEQVPGDLSLLRRLLDGDWADSEFLILRPGQRVVPSFDDRIIGLEIAAGSNAG